MFFQSVGFENHFLVSGKFVYILTMSSFSLTNTYNRPVYIKFVDLNRKCAAFTMDQFKSSERAQQAGKENGVLHCVPFCLRLILPFERCDSHTPSSHLFYFHRVR